jgi:hypothetical protein
MELGVTIKASVTNPTPGDLQLGDDGDEVVLTELQLEVAQRLWVAFNFFLGEWFLNLDEGTPWFQRILGKGVSDRDRVIRAVLGQVILTTEGVHAITRFSYSVDRNRMMSFKFTCSLEDGSTFKSTEFGEFLIAL